LRVKARGPKKLELVKTEKKNEKEKNEEGAETENKKTTWPKVFVLLFWGGTRRAGDFSRAFALAMPAAISEF
jgi:hypothetical protein